MGQLIDISSNNSMYKIIFLNIKLLLEKSFCATQSSVHITHKVQANELWSYGQYRILIIEKLLWKQEYLLCIVVINLATKIETNSGVTSISQRITSAILSENTYKLNEKYKYVN